MADSKVTQLALLGTSPATGDVLPVVDVSDTSMAASGTTKGVTFGDLVSTLATSSSVTSGLAAKANTSHTHAESDVTGLTTDLAGKAASVHTHAQSDVTGLVTALSGKASTTHAHAGTDITSGTVGSARLGSGTADATTFLRGDGSWAAPASASKPRIVAIPTLTDTGRYATNSNLTGFIDRSSGILLGRGSNAAGEARLTEIYPGGSNGFYDNNPHLWASVRLTLTTDSQTVIVTGNTGQSGGYAAGPYFGFRINGSSGAYASFYCVTSNGTSETATLVTSPSSTDHLHLLAVMTSGTNVKFYANGVLLATNTTNLPSGDAITPWMVWQGYDAGTGGSNGQVNVQILGYSYDAY